MLGKLIKYDWQRMWKVPVTLIVILNLVSLLAGGFFSGAMWETAFNTGYPILNTIAFLIMFIFIAGIVGASLGVFLYLAVSFYKSTYSDEGYLLHTLPVTPREILISKILVMSFLQLIVSAGIFLSILLLIFTAGRNLGITMADIISGFQDVRSELNYVFSNSSPSLTAFLLILVLSFIVSNFYSGTYIIASVSLGQLAKKHRIASSILAAVIINIGVSFVTSLAQLPVFSTLGKTLGKEEVYLLPYYFLYLVFITVIQTVITVVLYVISEYIMTRKLNLE